MVTRRDLIAAAGLGFAAPFVFPASAEAAAPLRVRRDVMEMADDDPFFAQYAAAVTAMHKLPESDGRNWRRQAKIHADFCKHGQLQFLHWHRHYVALFESICAQLTGDPGFTLPYWNWSKKSGVIPAPFFDIDALNVEFWHDPGVYSSDNWGDIDTVGKRGLAKGQGLLDDPQRGGAFTLATVNAIKTMPTAALFQGRLEGSPHNNGHVVAGATATGKTGHIGDGLSPLDPIFWLHHCMVDRVWAEWQQAGNATPDPGETYAGNFFDRNGASATATSGGALDFAALGYTYDVLSGGGLGASDSGALHQSILPSLEQALRERTPPMTLGAATRSAISSPLTETALKVSAPGLSAALASDRAFRQLLPGGVPGVHLESSRILAHFTGVVPPRGRSDLIVNVFVDCPYLKPTTPYTDPHYAGTFSFFGRMAHGHDAAGREGAEFVVDITAPVRSLASEGRIKDEQLTVQLMPLPAYMNGKSESTFQAGRVEIIAV